ncbi:putative E3 ubiquitin-protein ligase XBOS34 [Heracleum sosnowskyi]|uniref:E3 ubiquitin-protein ligase XBOS34 n=1 Tax=Heracleum sosnowskyi TaxID=360622 RepID=A0AAD8J678_9APIA|nr:putative E3 ubiquitin-protein ligase XBOS34 [Heracleum sosnowskyi]
MARLHQRMNSMQMTLEACMDMQLELQRSVRQEVSAALNWQSRLAEYFVPDESNLKYVRNGVCCLCRDAKIDSLLYRCGHMCACSKCAQKLLEGRVKCPMCRAPVIEVTPAYSIQ